MTAPHASVLTPDLIVQEMTSLTEWHAVFLRQCIFIDDHIFSTAPEPPSVIQAWCREEILEERADKKSLERLVQAYDEIKSIAQKMLSHARSSAPLTKDLYDLLTRNVDAYILQLSRLQKDSSGTGGTIDPVTGLRDATNLQQDLKKEQDRLDRKGTPFCIAQISLDNGGFIEEKYNRRTYNAVRAHLAKVSTKNLRSFDDAYDLGKAEYMLVLKHIDFKDAIMVSERIRDEVEKNAVHLPDGTKLDVTVSLGVVEAAEQEKVERTLDYAREAIAEAQRSGGNKIIEHRETSKLARFVQDHNK